MASTTISRATWTDDDGSGTTGTIINNARLQADVYDKVDALFTGASTFEFGGKLKVDSSAVDGLILLGGVDVTAISAPAVSAAGHGRIYFDGADNKFKKSENASPYSNLSTVLDFSTTEQDVVSSLAEVSIYAYTVKANTLGISKALRLTLFGEYFNNTGSSQNFTPRVKFDGTLIGGGNVYSLGANANREPIVIDVHLNNNGATNSQRSQSSLRWGGASATETDWASPAFGEGRGKKTGLAVDTTADRIITVTVQHGISDANLSLRRHAAILELIG